MVDIARPSQAKKKRVKRILWGAAVVIVIGGISLGVSKLKPAAPTVDRAVVWIDSVKRGDIPRQVRGSGTLVPEDIRWIPAQTQGRVERIVLRPGAQVTPDSVILEMSNPDLENAVRDAQLTYQSAQAAFTNRKAQLESDVLQQEANLANIETQAKQAALDLEAHDRTEARSGQGPEEPGRGREKASGHYEGRHPVAARAAGSGRELEESA